MRTVLWTGGILVLMYVAVCGVLYFRQRSLIYHPQRSSAAIERDVLKLATSQGDLLVSVWPQPGPRALLYFGGNAEDVRGSLPTLADAFPEHAIYGMHYRGYNGSAGSPTESALHEDALALYDKVRQTHPEVGIVGRSLGSGVAVRLASERPTSHLVLVTPYNSLQELAASQFPYLPISWLLLDRFESWRYAPMVTAPVLILEAEHDEVIPNASTLALAGHFKKELVTFTVIRGAGHNTVSDFPAYVDALKGAR